MGDEKVGASDAGIGGAADLNIEVIANDKFPETPPGATETHASEADGYGEETSISLRAVERVDVSVRNLSITVSQRPVIACKRTKKPDEESGDGDGDDIKILDDISADMPAGKLMAIIGGSGSGKTSMLNVMSHRMRGKALSISGSVTFNNSASLSNIRHAYVMQQDVLLPTLTVRETLQYAAELRLPSTTSHEERSRVVEEVVLQLGLKECANTRIGNNEHKGCSGGEKRRVSIGVQLLANPSVLFLDEPTTGLDATSAYQLVRTLKNLAMKGRTIITTVHQPRSEIWHLFDRITLLSRGKPVYSGKVSKVLSYFVSIGHPFPFHVNPADFLIDLSAVDSRTPEAEEASTARVASLVASWRESEGTNILSPLTSREVVTKSANDIANGVDTNAKAPLLRQIMVLTRRTFKITYRDPMGIAGSLIEAISMGIIAGWIFFDVDGSLSGIRSRQAALYISAALQGYLILLFETYRLTEVDIKVFDRERGEGVVGVAAFLISRRLARLVTEDVVVPLLFSVIFYFMVGFQLDAERFFTFFSIVLLGQYLAVTFATLSVGLSRNFAQATLISNLWYTMQSNACGFFIQASTMPVYVRWMKYVSYNWFAFGALVSNEFTDNFYSCPLEGGRNNPACLEYEGNFVLESLSFPRGWKAVPICVMLAWVVFLYVSAGLLLKYKTVEIDVSSSKNKDEQDHSVGKEKMSEGRGGKETRIDVVLDGVTLDIHKLEIFKGKAKDLSILKGISSRFEAGKLNVIMGPSGSGKSSLLNLMACRLHSSFFTRYRSSGKILFNNTHPSDSVIRSLCAYVTQDDDALLPSLTVRETLRFAAALRLPKWMSAEDKKQRAEQVLLKMGLKDCADNFIGSEFQKGISGGEKRRVTIAVQILMEPKILLLDEPTSGLDAFTAASILSVLRGLADEGCTVISTIHQSRSDLFEKFGNVLLLARGGHVVYSGASAQMLPYFSSLGHICPTTTNPADFALDLITVDLQRLDKETASREKVQKLIDNFSSTYSLPSIAESEQVVSSPAELGYMMREMAPFGIAYPVLLRRGLLNFRRQPLLVVARLMQVIGLAVTLALFFAPLGNDYYSVQNRLGFIQQILPLYFVGMLQNVALYPSERDVFYKEHDDGAYGVTAFFFSYLSTEIPCEVVTSLVFAVFAELAVGLPRTPELFFVVAFNAFCVTSCGESMGIFFNTLFQHTGFSVNVMSTVMSVGMFMGGIMSINMPRFLQAFNYLSPLRYVTRNLVPYSLENQTFTCTPEQRLPSGECPVATGADALKLYDLDVDPRVNLAALAAVAVVYRLVAYAVLRLRRMRLRIGREGK
ncbi:hypothetical protein RUND412_002141 [Rhizina undulata]